MADFKIGDKVRYKKDGFNPHYAGIEGEVTDIDTWSVGLSFRVTKTTPNYLKAENLISIGRIESVLKSSVELIEEAKEKSFKVGDTVTITGWEKRWPKQDGWEGRTGTVKTVWPNWVAPSALIEFSDGKGGSVYSNGTFNYEFLEHAGPKTLKFEDIRIGDKIKRTRTWPDGSEELTSGVVASKGNLAAYSKDDVALAFIRDNNRDSVTVELLERTESKPEPKLWENRKKGDVIIRKDEDGAHTVFTHEGGNEWSSIYLNDGKGSVYHASGKPSKGYDWNEDDIEDAFSNDDYTLTLIEA